MDNTVQGNAGEFAAGQGHTDLDATQFMEAAQQFDAARGYLFECLYKRGDDIQALVTKLLSMSCVDLISAAHQAGFDINEVDSLVWSLPRID